MPSVVITSVDPGNARPYIQVLESVGAEARLLLPADAEARSTEVLMEGAGGLLLPGGPDIDPALYGASPDPDAGLAVSRSLDDLELRLLEYALDRDMPVLAICRGMQLLNVAFGGRLIQDLSGHREEPPILPPLEGWVQGEHSGWESKMHQIYLSPGSKAAAVIGTAGFFRVNSRHHQGLREAQRAPRLMTTAYGVEDGLIEGLESPEHSWIIGLQCHPERQDEAPRIFANLFAAFAERAAAFRGAMNHGN